MRIDIITIFPQIFDSYFSESILKIAQEKNLIEIHSHNLRSYTESKHNKVDDIIFGGGAGMLMSPQPLFDCIEEIKKTNKGPVIYFTPQGKKLTQAKVERYSKLESCIIICGRYEGIDYRVREQLVDIELSLGDYVLTGGELAAMTFIDATVRLIPGVLGKEDSHIEDSFSKAFNRKKEYPQYTRPANFRGLSVPEVLLSGNHKKIAEWRKNNLK